MNHLRSFGAIVLAALLLVVGHVLIRATVRIRELGRATAGA